MDWLVKKSPGSSLFLSSPEEIGSMKVSFALMSQIDGIFIYFSFGKATYHFEIRKMSFYSPLIICSFLFHIHGNLGPKITGKLVAQASSSSIVAAPSALDPSMISGLTRWAMIVARLNIKDMERMAIAQSVSGVWNVMVDAWLRNVKHEMIHIAIHNWNRGECGALSEDRGGWVVRVEVDISLNWCQNILFCWRKTHNDLERLKFVFR